jgi:hypothetical protein
VQGRQVLAVEGEGAIEAALGFGGVPFRQGVAPRLGLGSASLTCRCARSPPYKLRRNCPCRWAAGTARRTSGDSASPLENQSSPNFTATHAVHVLESKGIHSGRIRRIETWLKRGCGPWGSFDSIFVARGSRSGWNSRSRQRSWWDFCPAIEEGAGTGSTRAVFTQGTHRSVSRE